MKKAFSVMSIIHINFLLKLNLKNVDQHTGGKWLIHHTKYHKNDQLQSLGVLCKISQRPLSICNKTASFQKEAMRTQVAL